MKRRPPVLPLCLSLCAPFCAISPALGQDMPQPPARPEAWQPPILTTERYNEDWSTLADPANRKGRWTEKFKYIPLDESGSTWLSTGLEFRLRSEFFRNNLWGSGPAPDDSYLWIRALPYVDLHAGPVRAFVQPIISYAVGVSPSPSPVDQSRVDLLQAFGDVLLKLGDDTTLRLRGGRELIGLGTERLVGTRYGPNTPQPFDGGRAIVHSGRYTFNVFYLQPVVVGPASFDDATSHSRSLWGAYATRLRGGIGVDAYYLGYRNEDAVYEQGSGREVRHTLGARSFGRLPSGWHWNVEAMFQFGHFDDMPIRAWSVGTEVGHSFPSAALKPDIIARFNVISGDKDAGDHKLQSFNAMFPKGKYFGELSPVGPRNIINGHIGATFDAGHGIGFGIAGMAYWRQSLGDGVYEIPGRLLRAGSGSRARFIGKQAEVSVSWLVAPELELSASASLFKPGSFIRDTGTADTIRMFGLESNFRF